MKHFKRSQTTEFPPDTRSSKIKARCTTSTNADFDARFPATMISMHDFLSRRFRCTTRLLGRNSASIVLRGSEVAREASNSRSPTVIDGSQADDLGSGDRDSTFVSWANNRVLYVTGSVPKLSLPDFPLPRLIRYEARSSRDRSYFRKFYYSLEWAHVFSLINY